MYCQHCGEHLADDAQLCSRCQRPPLITSRPSAVSVTDDPAMRLLLPVGRSVWAVLVVCAPVSLVLGLVALWDLKRHPEKHGMGRAIFAIVMGILCMLIPAVLIAASAINGSP